MAMSCEKKKKFQVTLPKLKAQLYLQSERCKTAEGDTKVITVTDPRTDITAEEAQEAMETILAANVIETNGGDLVEIVEARMRVTQVTILK